MRKKKRKHKKARHSKHTPLSQHKKVGTMLKGPLSALNFQQINWERDYLPEFLWIGALADKFGVEEFHHHYNAFLDALDKIWSESSIVPIGILSDFALVSNDRRESFVEENRRLVVELFHSPIGRAFAFYPKCPCRWLVPDDLLEEGEHLDRERELGYLRSLVLKLYPGKDEFTAQIRAVPLNRFFKHKKICFSSDLEVVNYLPKYPHGCSDNEKTMVESVARSVINMAIEQREDLKENEWAKHFWQHNYDLAVCRQASREVTGAHPVDPHKGKKIQDVLFSNAKTAREHLQDLRTKVHPDLYEPKRDEVLFGLLARVTRLYCLFCEDINLWARDVGAIFLRCLADTAITFCYLVIRGNLNDFSRFIEYGEGQQKLMMLHLQDNHPDEKSLEGLSVDEWSQIHEGFFPELLDIELGHWTKKDSRKLAKEIGMEGLYRLVYTPASNDLHGSWLSLKYSNLIHCKEALHRFHRIPTYTEPPFFINMAEVARKLYEAVVAASVEKLAYPDLIRPLTDLRFAESVDDCKATQDTE